jgi:hypothetical protein
VAAAAGVGVELVTQEGGSGVPPPLRGSSSSGHWWKSWKCFGPRKALKLGRTFLERGFLVHLHRQPPPPLPQPPAAAVAAVAALAAAAAVVKPARVLGLGCPFIRPPLAPRRLG